ncbi:hypothetical protein EIQ01_00840 [Xanthomonas campestris pv. raphani]
MIRMLRHIGIRIAPAVVGAHWRAMGHYRESFIARERAPTGRAFVCSQVPRHLPQYKLIGSTSATNAPSADGCCDTWGTRCSSSFGRSALARDGALPRKLHRARARSYRACFCLRSGGSTTDVINDQCPCNALDAATHGVHGVAAALVGARLRAIGHY